MAGSARRRLLGEDGHGSVTIESHGDGLYELLQRATRPAAHGTRHGLGVFELERIDREHRVTVHAVFATRDGRRVLDMLSARVHSGALDVAAALDVAGEALEDFGGTRYFSLEGRTGSRRRSFEVTVCFASVLPFLATNVAVLPPLRESEAAEIGDVLDRLGVHHKKSAFGLRIRSRQLRGPLGHAEQLAAFKFALESGFDPVVYAAALPIRQSARIAIELEFPRRGPPHARVDCALSRGLCVGQSCTIEDADDVELFLLRHFGIESTVGVWHARECRGAKERVLAAPRSALPPTEPRVYGHLRVLDGGAA